MRLTLSVTTQIKRRSGRKLVMLPIDPVTGEAAKTRPAWDTATTPPRLTLARGHRWLAMPESGEAESPSFYDNALAETINGPY